MAALLPDPSVSLALGLSGGGDSLALMHLLAGWARRLGRSAPAALVVDHGLRPESAHEAAAAAGWAREAGLTAHVLRARPARGNIEDAARRARYRLMGRWCRAQSVPFLVLGHTRDDQAETFLLRLARGSGLDGLAAMRAHAPFPVPGFADVSLLRPLLGFDRAGLRAFLTARGAGWIEDPMNVDPHFARVRLRALLPRLDQAGLSPARIAAASAHLGRARAALEAVTEAFLAAHAKADGEAALLDRAALLAQPREIGLRALAALLMRVSGAPYRGRFDRLERLYAALECRGAARTLAGCRIGPAPRRAQAFGPETVRIAPESPRNLRSRKPCAPKGAQSMAQIKRLTVS